MKNIWNIDQHGEHFDSIPDTTIAPKGTGKYLKHQTYKARERYTVTVGINGVGQVGFGCITFKETDSDKSKTGKFGPIVAGRLENLPECEYLWLQASSSGLQHKENVFDYFRNVVGCGPYKRVFLLDGLRSWQAIENRNEIEKITNGVICTIGDGLTCLLQPCDTDLFRMFNARMTKQNTQHIKKCCQNGDKSTKPRTRENVLTDVLIVLSDIANNKQDVLAQSWRKNGYWLALDGTEDFVMRTNIYINEQQRAAGNIIPVFNSAAERLNAKLPRGPKATELGSSQPRTTNNVIDYEIDSSNIICNPLVAIRANLRKTYPDLFNDIKFFPQTKGNNHKLQSNTATYDACNLPSYLNDDIDDSDNEQTSANINCNVKPKTNVNLPNYNLYEYTDYSKIKFKPNITAKDNANHTKTNNNHQTLSIDTTVINNTTAVTNSIVIFPNCSNIIKPNKIWSTTTCDPSQLKRKANKSQTHQKPAKSSPTQPVNTSNNTKSHSTSSKKPINPDNISNNKSSTDDDIEVISPASQRVGNSNIDLTSPLCNSINANNMWNKLTNPHKQLLWSKRIGAWYWYILNSPMMLCDFHIEAAYDLVKAKFPKYCGMRTVVIQRSTNDKMRPLESNFGGCIFHCDPSLHWILATRSANQSIVNIYDSMGVTFNPLIKRSVAELFVKPGVNSIDICFRACCQQRNGIDCGLFAIANLFAVAQGYDPSRLRYNIQLMRPHLRKCLLTNKFALFPLVVHPRQSVLFQMKRIDIPLNPYLRPPALPNTQVLTYYVRKPTTYSLTLVCDCKLPDDIHPVIDCCQCKKIFHKRCVGMENRRSRLNAWTCNTCTNNINQLADGVSNAQP